MDVQKTIDEVVEGVKSEGLFDQFRKECLEEFENMETYHQLKQRVENHVTSFLSKYRYHDGLQKNTLRSNLRNYISKSEVLINSITQLVDEVLSLKGKSFCLRIDKQVDKHLSKNVPTPVTPTEIINPPHNDDSNSTSSQSCIPVDSPVSNSNNTDENYNSSNSNVIVEGQKEILANGTVTEFTEMEIEEVEMEISENPEVFESGVPVVSDQYAHNIGLDTIKMEDGSIEQSFASNNTFVETVIKSEPENTFQPIAVIKEDVNTSIVKKEDNAESESSDSSDSSDATDDTSAGMNLPPIITEPISEDSNSNDSTFADNITAQMSGYRALQDDATLKKEDLSSCRKSSRVRTLPLKLRELDDLKKHADDGDSLSSNDIDYKDLEDGSYQTGKRGRPRKRPQSAGNPEIAKGRIERPSSISRLSVECTSRKHGSSISKQEEEAINFLTKPSVRKAMAQEVTASPRDNTERKPRTAREHSCEGNVLDKDDSTRYSEYNDDKFRGKNERKFKQDPDSGDRIVSKAEGRKRDHKRIDYDRKNRPMKDKKDREFREGTLSSGGDDKKLHARKDHEGRRDHKKDDDRKVKKSSASEKDPERRDRKLSGSGKDYDRRERHSSGSGQDDNRSKSSGSGKDSDRKDLKFSVSRKDGGRKDSKLLPESRNDEKKDHKSPLSGKDDKKKEHKSGKDNTRREHNKDMDRKEPKSSSSVKDDERSLGWDKDSNRSEQTKRDYLSDSGTTSTSSKDDLDRKSRTDRDDDVTRENRDSHMRKRPHSPIASPEDSHSKRSRRSIKQRQRYSPP